MAMSDAVVPNAKTARAKALDEPAPSLALVPTRRAGWNKLSISQEVPDLSVFFDDALIVWRGNAAYSKSPTTADLIKATTGVSALTALAVGDEVWVRY